MKTTEERIEHLLTHVNALKNQKEQLEMFIGETIVEIENLKTELEQEKPSFPVGFDPDGNWTVVFSIENGWYVQEIYGSDKSYYAEKGICFTTKEQAILKADGLNALKELIFEIHKENDKTEKDEYAHHYEYLFKWDIGELIIKNYDENAFILPPRLHILSLRSAEQIVEKLGEEKIKLALEWGL